MPVTFAHPSIIFPFLKRKSMCISATGAIVGSITPDFEYFFRMNSISLYSHSFSGLFWFDLPVGLLLCFLFHALIKRPFFDNISPRIKNKLLSTYNLDWTSYFKRKWLTVTLSIILGAASHLLWDGFTHPKGFFVTMIPALSLQLNFHNYSIYLYRLFQHISSIIGSLVVIYAILKLPYKINNNEIVKHKIYLMYWVAYLLFSIFILSIKSFYSTNEFHIDSLLLNKDFLISVLSSFILGIIPTSLVWIFFFRIKILKKNNQMTT